MRKIWTSLLFVLFASCAYAQTAVIPVYYCAQNGVQAKTSGLLSSNYLMGVVPFCTVTIYMTGTTTIAATTPQTPLKANANGSIPPIYAATGIAYDVKFSGGYSPNTYTTPVTRTGVMAGGAGGGGSPGGSNTDVQVNVLGSFGGYSTLTYDPADGLCIGGCPSGYGVSIGPLGTMTSSWNFDTTNPLTAIDSLTGSGTTDYVWTWNGSTGQWEANSGSAGVTSITPGTNTNCTPLVDGVCTGPVTISAAAATSVATTTQSASATYYPVFVPANSSSNQAVSVGPMSYNPGTGTLSTSQYISTVATGTAPLTVTSTTPVANLSIGGTAANVTATSNATLSTLSALSLPYSQLSGTIPTWNQNTTGTSASSTNLLGGAVGSAPYQSALNTTAFLASPTTSGHTFVYSWQPLGSPISPVAYDLTPTLTLAGNSVQISGSPASGNVGCWVTYGTLGSCSSPQIQTALGNVYAQISGAAFTGPVSAPSIVALGHSAFGANSSVNYAFPKFCITENACAPNTVLSLYEASSTAAGVNGLISEIDLTPTSNTTYAPNSLVGDMELNLDSSGTSNSIAEYANYLTLHNNGNTVEANWLNALQTGVINTGNAPVNAIEAVTVYAGNNGSGAIAAEDALTAEISNSGSGVVNGMSALTSVIILSGASTNASVRGFTADGPALSGGATITNYDGVLINGCGTNITNCYQLYITSSTGATNSYGIYQPGTQLDFTAGAWTATGGFNVGTTGSPTTAIPSTALAYVQENSGLHPLLVLSAPVTGLAVLVSGTVTVANTAACTPTATTCVYKLTNCAKNASTGIGTLSVGTVSVGTSFVINSLGPTGSVLTTDASSVCWQIN